FIGLVAGLPAKVFATGLVNDKGVVDYLMTSYLYGPGGPAVTCASGALAQKGRPFVHGYEIYLERATLLYESGVTPLTVLSADGQSARPDLAGDIDPVSAFAAEIQAAVDGIAAGKLPDLLSGKLAR